MNNMDASLRKIRNQVNSIEISSMSRKTKNSGKVCLEEINLQRQLAEEKYKKQDEIRKQYAAHDSKQYPAYIFCIDEIVETYGLCPYIFLNISNTSTANLNDQYNIEQVENNRKHWLSDTQDKGALYYELYNRINNMKTIQTIESDRNSIIIELDEFLTKVLSSEQYNTLIKSEEDLIDYKNAAVKSKKKKEQFNQVINQVSMLVGMTKLSIHKMLSIKYDIQFIINDIQTHDIANKVKQDHFNTLLENWEILNNNYKQEIKAVRNTREFAEIKLVDLHLKYEESGTNIVINQKGKYFKKWSSLKDSEKYERIDSYAKYFIRKCFTLNDIISKDKEESLVLKLNTILQNAINEKIISSTSIKWNIKTGIITTIKGLDYVPEQEDFTLATHQRQPKLKKRASQKTIFVKANETVINDTILKCILKEMTSSSTLTEVKDKLKINKISTEDRNVFDKRFNEIKCIVKNN